MLWREMIMAPVADGAFSQEEAVAMMANG